MNTTAYEQGFIQKCAEHNINPVEALAKVAQDIEPSTAQKMLLYLPMLSSVLGAGHGFIDPPAGQTPVLGGLMEGTGAGLGTLAGMAGGGAAGAYGDYKMDNKELPLATGGAYGGGTLGGPRPFCVRCPESASHARPDRPFRGNRNVH